MEKLLLQKLDWAVKTCDRLEKEMNGFMDAARRQIGG